MMTMSAAQKLFDSINLDTIKSFVVDGEQEHLHLDFKTVGDSELSKKDDKRSLARAVSGFANSDGGVIVWGVVAKRNEDGADVASDLKPIANARLFRSRLESMTGEAATPLVDGLQHREFISTGDEGFVASLVPATNSGPHMAKLGENRYYKRSGDSFYPMEHFDIADMFGRRSRPELSFYLSPPEIGLRTGTDGYVVLVFGLRNSGRGVAQFPALDIRITTPCEFDKYGIDGNGHFGISPLLGTHRRKQRERFGGGVDDVVHPNSVLEVSKIRVPFRLIPDEWMADCAIEFTLYAQGIQPVVGSTALTGNQIRAAIDGQS